MEHATIQISAYISAHGILVCEDPATGFATIRDGGRVLRGRRIASTKTESAAA